MEPIIEFSDYTFKYRSQIDPTLFDINLKIFPGEKILIAGPSGSGKSTIGRCLNGLIPFANKGDVEGKLTIAGKDPNELGIFGLSKIVGTVLQDTDGQFIGLTVAEDIAFALENDMIPVPEMRQKVEKVANLVDVDSLLQNSPSALSGGQKQRVAIAGVLVDDVDVLLFDEPLANLDPAAGKNTIALIDEICRDEKKTVIIIEHRLEDALYRDVDRIVVVNEGRIIADMTPDELLCTDILSNAGIREPLYITALKHTGCKIASESKPQHIESMNTEAYAEQVRRWYEETPSVEKEVSAEEVLRVSDISFSYVPGKNIIKDASFVVYKGEMVSIVGKNGAGKSTISNLICGFIKPDSGAMYINGNDISDLSVKERGEYIGLVMQNPNQMISKPMIFDEVALGLRARGVNEDEIKERVNNTLKICGLYPFRNWPVNALSFGQKKRVTIASVLVLNPDIIILDEPTAGQDYRHYTEIMEFLKRINEEHGITIIMMTHDMHLMLEYTQRAIVICDGSVIMDSSPSKVLTHNETVERASLKRTSLYDLAKKCGIDDASKFVDKFIDFETRYHRNHKEDA